MTNTKWTPGPWRYVNRADTHVVYGPKPPEGDNLPLFTGARGGWRHHDEANARLIAAAPDLYDAASSALQYIVLAYRDGKDNGLSEETLAIAERDHKRLVAALAKARGDAEGGAS